MVDNRTNYAREVTAKLRENYGSGMKVFQTEIPHSVRAAETSAEGKSIFAHDPKGKVAAAYEQFTREVLAVEKQRAKMQLASLDDLFSTQASRTKLSGKRCRKSHWKSCIPSPTIRLRCWTMTA